jgi:NADH-quinone oxidoreductase subunit F
MPAPEQLRIIFKHIDEPGYTNDIDCYIRNGGYEVLKKAVGRKPEELIDEVKKSGLRGRGGAGFPCGVKWGLVDRKSGKPIYLIVNADESEPGTFKDRYIMHQDPHQLIEGTIISCFANNVKQAYIYIRGEMPEGARILEKAVAESATRITLLRWHLEH